VAAAGWLLKCQPWLQEMWTVMRTMMVARVRVPCHTPRWGCTDRAPRRMNQDVAGPSTSCSHSLHCVCDCHSGRHTVLVAYHHKCAALPVHAARVKPHLQCHAHAEQLCIRIYFLHVMAHCKYKAGRCKVGHFKWPPGCVLQFTCKESCSAVHVNMDTFRSCLGTTI
jgi:hypothetical protein